MGGLRGTSAEPNAVTSPEQRAKRAAAWPPQSSHGSCQLLSKAPSGGGGRADAASWGRGKVCDRGHALRKVLVGREPETPAAVGVSCDQLSRRSPCPHGARSQGLRPEGVRRSAPAGTAARSTLPFRRGNCGAGNERTSYGSPLGTTQVQVPAGEGGSGVPPGPKSRESPGRGLAARGSLATFPPSAETRTLTASTRLPAPAAVLPALLRDTPGSQTRAPGHRATPLPVTAGPGTHVGAAHAPPGVQDLLTGS